MNNKSVKNIAASVRERLYQLAQKRGEDFQLMLTRYGLERLLYRLDQSPYRDRFVLKAAILSEASIAGRTFTMRWGPAAYGDLYDIAKTAHRQ